MIGFGFRSTGPPIRLRVIRLSSYRQIMGGIIAVVLALSVFSAVDPGPVFATCADAKAAGVSNIPKGDPAYWPGGDRDDDGIACESD